MHSKHIKFPEEAGFSVGGMVLLARLQKAFGIISTWSQVGGVSVKNDRVFRLWLCLRFQVEMAQLSAPKCTTILTFFKFPQREREQFPPKHTSASPFSVAENIDGGQ